MKFFKKITLGSIVLCSILTTQCLATTGRVNVSATRIREKASTEANILTNIYQNEKVEILEDEGQWYKVTYNQYTGYVKKEFLDASNHTSSSNTNTNNIAQNTTNTNKDSNTSSNNRIEENAQPVPEESSSNQAHVSDGMSDVNQESNVNAKETTKGTLIKAVKLRVLPNFMSKQKEEIGQGTEVEIIEELNDWVQVTDGTVKGWVLQSRLSTSTTETHQSSSNANTTDNKPKESDKNEVNTVNNSNRTNTVDNTTDKTNTVSKEELHNTVENNTTVNETSINKKGKINVESAKVRRSASSNGTATDVLDYGDQVTISAEEGDWYKISCKGITGYVNKRLITLINENENTVTSRSLTEDRNQQEQSGSQSNIATSVNGNSVVEYAKQYLGYPYVLGGKTPETGFDCSGFTRYIFQHFGYTLANVAAEQTSVGKEIARAELKEGDLILFYNDSKTKIGHTGIYTGNGNFIHAANAKRGVVIDNLNQSSYYHERFVSARRIIE